MEWYHVCWPRLTAKRVAPIVSISWASCKANKAPGYDDVLPKIVKSTIHVIAEPLSIAINVSTDQGIAKVVPIFKSDDKMTISNCRSASVLSIFSKSYEKVMRKRLYGYFVENNFLVDNQFGFKEQHCTVGCRQQNPAKPNEKENKNWNPSEQKSLLNYDLWSDHTANLCASPLTGPRDSKAIGWKM